jgi:Rho-binding antiterminator
MEELPPYEPIACSLHDRIEDAAVRSRVVDIVYRNADGTRHGVSDRIVDWFSREGAEFLTTASGLVLRLDQILSIDGVEFRSA